jgi:hypothetical protein
MAPQKLRALWESELEIRVKADLQYPGASGIDK